MEELLNKLIEKGFIPFNIPGITELKYYETKQKLWITSFQNTIEYHDEFSLRDVVSKESGLWQFVCENGMVYEQVLGWEEYHWAKCTADKELREHYSTYSLEYEYRLIESALKDESELEEFLLDNIKIDDLRICG